MGNNPQLTPEGLPVLMDRAYEDNQIREIGIIPAIRVSSTDDAHFAIEAVASGGIPIVEVTMTVPGAVQLISHLVEHHQGELFPRVGFIVTNLSLPSRAVVRFYNKRGTAEQWIKEGKQAVKMTRLSCYRFRSNEVRLLLSLIAYNLGNLWRRLVLPKKIENWSLTSLQQRLVKTGGRLVKHARYYWLLLAEGHLTRRVFAAILRRIWALPLPAG
jgi:hypothetical protein